MEPFFKRKSVRGIGALLLLVVICGYAALLAAMNRAMHQAPEQFGKFMSKMPVAVFFIAPFETMWTRARAGNLAVGDVAPDFTLPTQDKTGRVTLSSIRNDKPIVLVFGSYT